MTLFWRSALRYALQRRWQTGLNILGILIGVMMVVAVDLANNSARHAFDLSLDILNGSLTHQVVGGSDGVPDTVFTRLKTELGIRRAAPTLSGQVMVNGRELTLVGIDVISEATLDRRRPGLPVNAFAVGGDFLAALGSDDGVVMAAVLADTLGLSVGDAFTLRTFGGAREATLAATYATSGEATGELVLADIAAAQRLLGRRGRLDSIDLVLEAADTASLQNWLPRNLLLTPAQVRNDNVRQMSEAFHINLQAMSLLSLLVAGLLIYNTVTLSVLQRRRTLGILRAEGVTRGQVCMLVLGENAVMGLVASLFGVIAGYWLGRFLVTLVTRTVDDLYFDLAVNDFFVDPWVLAKGLVLGVLLSLVSAALPAFSAARSKPVSLQHNAADASDWVRRLPVLAVAGVVLMVAGGAMLLPAYGALATGFVALTLLVFGFCLLVPLALYGLLTAVLVAGRGLLGLPGLMALRNARSAINRTGLAVAALCVAVSVTVGVGVMTGSFRGTVILWLEQSLPGDMQLTAVSGDAARDGIPDGLRAELAAMPGIAGLHDSVLEEVESGFGPVRLGVNDLPAADKFYMQAVAPEGFAAFDRGEGVFISEPLAYLNRIGPGDTVPLLTGNGMTSFPVLGVFHDYTSGTGMVHMHASLYGRHWARDNFSRLTLDLAAPAAAEALETAIEARLAAYGGGFTLVSNRRLRELTLQIFDRTFAITNVLRLLAILVAFVGVVSTLMALQLERLREFAILRATGMTPIQVAGLIFRQTATLGICAGLLALPLGLMMSDVLIDVINRRSFGWTMQHFLPDAVLAEGFVLALVAALLAGLYPAWRAGRIRPALALREE